MLSVDVLIATVDFQREMLWSVSAVFLLIRPLEVYAGLLGTGVARGQRNLTGGFGIRSIGSLYYPFYAINHDIQPALAERLLSLTLAVVVSVVAHGTSATPLMAHYEVRNAVKKKQQPGYRE